MTTVQERPTLQITTPPRRTGVWPWLVALCAVSSVLSLRPGSNTNAFQDEGLYLFMGHRMIDHVLSGVKVTEYPGSYFSGAPGLYPVLGSLADSIGGLTAARLLSLVFVWVAIVAVFGIGSQLFGTLAGLLGAASYMLCGSVIFLSHMATFDAMAMSLIAVALWLTSYSAKRDNLLWAPVVGLILAVAFLAKYAVAVYIPGVALVGMILTWRRIQFGSLRRGIIIVASAAAICFFVLTFWAQDLVAGIVSTTTSRTPISPASPEILLTDIGVWVGLWVAVAVLGALTLAKQWPLTLTLLVFSVIAPLQQVRIGEETSLSKHVAFGMVFAAPLIGALLSWFIGRSRWLGWPVAACALSVFLVLGATQSQKFLTTWVDDSQIVTALRQEIAISPDKSVLGEEPSAQRYELRDALAPIQWNDTFSLGYGGKTGMDAYREAIDQTHFGTIYLTLNTANGKKINEYMTTSETPYRLSAKIPFTRYGDFAGYYLVWTPKVLER